MTKITTKPGHVWRKGQRIETETLVFGPEPKKKQSGEKFAIVPLNDDWGYWVMSLAGRGAGIVLHALYVQRTTGKGDVPITAAILQHCGISRHARTNTIARLVRAGVATVRYRGKFQGCPLLTIDVKSQHRGRKVSLRVV
jgi:hypothetical protein